MRTSHRFFAHAAATLVAHASRVVAGVFLPPFVLASIGKQGYGLTVLVTSTMTFLALLQLGVPQSAVRYLSETLTQGDLPGARKIYSSSVVLMCLVGVAASAIIVLIAYHPEIMGAISADLSATEVRWTVLLLGAATVFSMPLIIGESCITARKQFVVYSGIQTATTLLRVIAVFVVLSAVSEKLLAYVIITASCTVIPYLAATHYQSVSEPMLRFCVVAVDTKVMRVLFKHGSAVLITTVAWLFMVNINYIIVGRYLGTEQLALFSLAMVWSTILQGVATSISQVLLSDASERSAQGDLAYLRDLVCRSSKFLFVGITPAIIFLMLFRKSLILTWLGPGFETTALIMLPIMVGEFFTVVNSPAANIAIVTGMVRIAVRWNVALALVSTFTLLAGVTIGHWGLGEAAIVYAAVFALRGGVLYPILLASHLKTSIVGFYRDLYLRPLAAFLLTVLVLIPLSGQAVSGWLPLIGLAALTGCVGITFGYFVALDAYERKIIVSLVRKVGDRFSRCEVAN